MTPRKPGRPRGIIKPDPFIKGSVTLKREHWAHLDARGINRSEVLRDIMEREIAREEGK